MSHEAFTLFSENLPEKKNRRRHDKVTFKPYSTDTEYLFPESTSDYLPDHHIARLLSVLIDRIDISNILAKYKGGGASAYDPRMFLKVWLLGFIYKLYSCRDIAKACREHVAFIWISGQQQPDFTTLNKFRLKLESEMKVIFKEVVQLGIKLGIIEGKDVFLDHSKMEASANRFKIFWRKSIERYQKKAEDELELLFSYVARLEKAHKKTYGNKDYCDGKKYSDSDIDEMIANVNDALKKRNQFNPS